MKSTKVPQAKVEKNQDILSSLSKRDDLQILDTFSFAEEENNQPLASKLVAKTVPLGEKQETLEAPQSEERDAAIGVDQGVGASHNTFNVGDSLTERFNSARELPFDQK